MNKQPKSKTESKDKKVNPWIEHLMKFKKDHPTLSFKECIQQAKLSYKK